MLKSKKVLRLLCFLGGGYLFLCLSVYLLQSKMVFIPTAGAPVVTPQYLQLKFEDVMIPSGQGKVHGWYISAVEARGTVLFCHGNAGNIGHRLETIKIWHKLGINVLIFDYRGYGLSQGSPSEENCYEDVEACYHWLQQNKEKAGPLIIHGRSLGGGVASWAAENLEVDGLILESTFTSVPDMGSSRFPFLPIFLLCDIHFSTEQRLKNIKSPLLMFHSPHDEIIPFSMGEKLAATAGVELNLLQGGHNGGFLFTDNYSEKLNEFIASLSEPFQEPS